MSLLRGANDLAQFIARNYTGRVVEVGAGHVPEVALGLQARGLDVVLTDKEERLLCGLRVEKDDIFSAPLGAVSGGKPALLHPSSSGDATTGQGPWQRSYAQTFSSGLCRMRWHSYLALPGSWLIAERPGSIYFVELIEV